jgi:predicted NACHT family NTPase
VLKKIVESVQNFRKAMRAIHASESGLILIKQTFKLKGQSQTYLAGSVGCTRQTVNKFLNGKPIDKSLFQTLCSEIGLEWLQTANLEEKEQPFRVAKISVESVRAKVSDYLIKRCGTMRVLDMEQPITLNSIYTTVNILEQVSRNRRLSVDELHESCGGKDFDRLLLGSVKAKRVPGLEAIQCNQQLMILGKPGAGKTTFLKWLTLQCLAGVVQGDRVPFFITLKEFAETEEQPDLVGFLTSQLEACDVTESRRTVEELLRAGRLLLLLDGLDEVQSTDHDQVLTTIRQAAQQYAENQFIITCRIAAREYTFDQFTEVEIADFDDQQIADFATNWFQPNDPVKAQKFTQVLREESHQGLWEMATNPLLLTLLCLVFGSRGSFPANRSELYGEGIDVLFKKWDIKRNIHREELYQQLSLKRKEDLLSRIAYQTFSHGEYFFKQKMVEAQIQDYIRNLPGVASDPEALQVDSEVVLKAIEAHHSLLVERARGIYSFSHLTFQEFFTARYFEKRNGFSGNFDNNDFDELVNHVNEPRWREVILLIVGMLENADWLLIKIKKWIDSKVANDENIQQYLQWVEQKSNLMKINHEFAAIRAYYFALDLAFDSTNLANILDRALYLDHDLALDLNLSRTFRLALDQSLANILNLDLTLDHHFIIRSGDQELLKTLQHLQDSLPTHSPEKKQEAWWQSQGQEWINQLRAVMIEHRNIGHDWQFSSKQHQLLQQYYDANLLLVDCLNSDCYVSREVRVAIEDQLLLPMASIAQLSLI